MSNYRPLSNITPAVKAIIIINVIIFLLINLMGKRSGIDWVNILGLHLPESKHFAFYQYITHMFTQEGLTHIFFNMFAVFMFGRILESVWGSKRFVIYYMVTGIGAGTTLFIGQLDTVTTTCGGVLCISKYTGPRLISRIFTNSSGRHSERLSRLYRRLDQPSEFPGVY